jgi:hypothetical protein
VRGGADGTLSHSLILSLSKDEGISSSSPRRARQPRAVQEDQDAALVRSLHCAVLRSGNGSVRIFKPTFNEVDGMKASGEIVGVYQKTSEAPPQGYLFIP